MAIRRKPVKPEERYTIISNAWARDERLSLKARGLLTLILSHRVGWNITIESLARTNPEGKAAIRTAVNELESFGYLAREHMRDEGGAFVGYDYVLTDPPACDFQTEPFDNRTGSFDYPTTDNPTLDNRTPKKTISKKTNTKNTPAAESGDEFESFWSAYPGTQKGSKKTAEKKYLSLLRTMSHDDVMARLDHWKKSRQRMERAGEFVPKQPHVTTWLNQERWNDFGEFGQASQDERPSGLSVDEVDRILGPDMWSPPAPDASVMNIRGWLAEQHREHRKERLRQALERVNGKSESGR